MKQGIPEPSCSRSRQSLRRCAPAVCCAV